MRVIISGGGTGGHIYPAIAIAQEIQAHVPEAKILFVGAKGRMEMEKVPAAGFPIEGLWISGIRRKLSLDNLSFPLKLGSSLLKARRIVRSFRPDVAIGVGGYASGPLLYAASGMGIPCLIQEQNSFAGLTNRWLAKRVQSICVAYDGMERFFPRDRIVLTGNPVRRDIIEYQQNREEAAAFFQLDPKKKTILVVGGSQGARSINEGISQHLSQILEQDIQLIWQTGKNTFQQAPDQSRYVNSPLLHKTEFIYRMDFAYSAADIVISRAGALAVSELCIVGKPVVFVPLPTAAEDHQTQNALSLVHKEAAEVIADASVRTDLVPATLGLLADERKMEKLRVNIHQLAKPSASTKIREEIMKLVKMSR